MFSRLSRLHSLTYSSLPFHKIVIVLVFYRIFEKQIPDNRLDKKKYVGKILQQVILNSYSLGHTLPDSSNGRLTDKKKVIR